jgi:surface polysaccharide O-acyltransferase-like enzyme
MKKKSFLSKRYSFAADVVRVIAIIGVVSIHVLIAVYDRADFRGGGVWWITNIWNSLSRPAIPLFIMLSGSLLIDKKEQGEALRKRIVNRLAIPLISFTVFFKLINGENLNPWLLFSSLIKVNVGILYFLTIVLGLYIFLPLIRKGFLPLKLKQQFFIAMMFILGAMGIVLIEYYLKFFFLNNLFLMWIPYLGFFLIGHVLSKVKFNLFQKLITFFAYLMTVVATILLSNHYLSQSTTSELFPVGALSPYYDFHLSPNLVIMSLTLFVLLFQFNYKIIQKSSLLKSIIQEISKASFGIYLLHLFVITALEKYLRFSVDFVQLPLLLFLLIKFFLVLIGSYGLTIVFKKTPILKNMVLAQIN